MRKIVEKNGYSLELYCSCLRNLECPASPAFPAQRCVSCVSCVSCVRYSPVGTVVPPFLYIVHQQLHMKLVYTGMSPPIGLDAVLGLSHVCWKYVHERERRGRKA